MAPDELKSDMDAAVQVWHDQQLAVAQSVESPVGAISASLTSIMFNSASIKAVDTYAVSDCNESVFGTVLPSVAPTSGTGAYACPAEGSSQGPTIDASTSLPDFIAEFSQMASSADVGLAEAADAFVKLVTAEVPTPATAEEALGRAQFDGTDVHSMLSSWATKLNAVCGYEIVSSDEVDSVEKITPSPVSGSNGSGVAVGFYDQCEGDSPTGWTAPFIAMKVCSDGKLRLVDMTTGIMTAVAGFPSSAEENIGDIVFVGDTVAWTQAKVTPASGLQAERTSVLLHLRSLTGADIADPVIDTGEHASAARTVDSTVVQGNDVVLGTSFGRVAYSNTGKLLWRTRDVGLLQSVSRSLVELNGTVYDSHTGRKYASNELHQNYDVDSAVCGDRALLINPGDSFLAVTTKNGTRLTRLAFDPVRAGTHNEMTPFGVVEESGDPSALKLRNFEDKVVWSIPGNVVSDEDTAGKYVMVTNASGEKILVDAATGKDITNSRPDLIVAISNTATVDASALKLASDPSHVILQNSSFAFRLAASDMCG